MLVYVGSKGKDGVCAVHKVGWDKVEPLPLRLDLRNHSPAGFNWGYGGSGPAQLALALLADALECDYLACKLYQEFKRQVISRTRDDVWVLTHKVVSQWALGRAYELLLRADGDTPAEEGRDNG